MTIDLDAIKARMGSLFRANLQVVYTTDVNDLVAEVEKLREALKGVDSHTIKLMEECVRFTCWAAGEGFVPSHVNDTLKDPEDIFFDYSVKTGDEDWEGLADKILGELNELLSTQLGDTKD